MGESTDSRTTLQFDRHLRLEFHGATLTSGAGLDAAVLPPVRGQPGAVGTVHPGLQPRELPAPRLVGAQRGQALVATKPPG